MTPNNVLSPEFVELCIKDKQFVKMWAKTTICLLTLDNDFEVVWCSHPLHADAFDEEVWKTEAYKDAFNKAFEFIAFRLHDMRTPITIATPEPAVAYATHEEDEDVLIPNSTD